MLTDARTGIFVHPTALVESSDVATGTRVWAFTHVMAGAQIGSHCNIGDHTFVEQGATIGNYVTVKNANMIWKGVTLEDGVFVGPNVVFTNDLFPRSQRFLEMRGSHVEESNWLVPTLVKEGASIGGGAVIIAGVSIGEFAVVAGGAVVTRDVPAHGLVRGDSARLSGWVCECGRPLHERCGHPLCDHCGRVYF